MRSKAKRFLLFLDKGGLIICAVFCAAAVIISYVLAEAPRRPSKSAAVYENADETVSPLVTIRLSFSKTETPPSFCMPLKGEITRGFSSQMVLFDAVGAYRAHMAVDISAQVGSPVCAVADGRVADAGYYDDIGFFTLVEHSGGFSALYASLAGAPSVIKGDPVREGDELGIVGKSGLLEMDAEPHLHFAVYENGSPVDPCSMTFWEK